MAEYFDPLDGAGLGGMDFSRGMTAIILIYATKLPRCKIDRIATASETLRKGSVHMASIELRAIEKWFDDLQVIKSAGF